MSYDLHIIAKRHPRAADMHAFVDAAGSLEVSGAFKRGSALLLSDATGAHAEVDGPDRIESEDVPDTASGAIGAAGWQVTLSAKSASEASWPEELAVHLARSGNGVVYDPQLDAVTWPKGWRPRAPGVREQVSDFVSFTWYMTHPEHRDRPLKLLDLLRAHCPQSLPRRYGEYEPCQHRFEGDAAELDFADFWMDQAASSLGFFFWMTERPCLGATVSMTSPSGPEDPRAQPCTHLTLSVDARPFHRDPDFARSMVNLFVEVAATLRCLYAGAFLSRTMNNGPVNVLEGTPFPWGSEWVGLPASPTWLAWFGTPYADAVRSAVSHHITQQRGDGLFLQLGHEPLNADELAPLFPRLPGRLLARRGNGRGRWLPGKIYTMGRRPPSDPAADMPAFTR